MKSLGKVFLTIVLVICLGVVCPVNSFAADSYIVYNDPHGFPLQAKTIAKRYSPGAKIYFVRSSDDFVAAWGKVAKSSSSNLILMLHGGNGVLYFYNEGGWNGYSKLPYLGGKLTGSVMSVSCQGGSGGSNSVAFNLAKRSAAKVVAAKNSSVNYGLVSKEPLLDSMIKGNWVKISAIKGKTYREEVLGKVWKYRYLN